MTVEEMIEQAIMEGARAGVFRAAERLNPKAAKVWADFAEIHTERSAKLLGWAVNRLGEKPSSSCENDL